MGGGGGGGGGGELGKISIYECICQPLKLKGENCIVIFCQNESSVISPLFWQSNEGQNLYAIRYVLFVLFSN